VAEKEIVDWMVWLGNDQCIVPPQISLFHDTITDNN
jgi:hypothetical protein